MMPMIISAADALPQAGREEHEMIGILNLTAGNKLKNVSKNNTAQIMGSGEDTKGKIHRDHIPQPPITAHLLPILTSKDEKDTLYVKRIFRRPLKNTETITPL